jgi:hypothetical protein
MSPWYRSALGLALLGGLVTGCGVSPAVQAARDREYTQLSRELASEKTRGELDDGEVRDVAQALADAEISAAKGKDGEATIARYSGCADEVEGALDDRSEADDDVAAAAASVLLSAGLVDEDEYVDFIRDGDPRPAFRALGARGLVDDDDFELRRKLFLDLDERVRANALKAAMSSPSPDDVAALVDAARLDPFPGARGTAARALGRIGGAKAVRALKDLWLHADGRLREAIVDALVSPASFEAGGRDALVRAAEEGGEGGLAAALLLARIAPVDRGAAAAKDVGVARLERAIESGTREERALAMLMAPSSKSVLSALRKAKDDSDPGLAALALARLAREGDLIEQKASRDALLALAKKDDPEAARALGELALLGDERAAALLEKQLADPNAFARAYAGRALVTLGHSVAAAMLLADKEASVRADVACAVLRER